jgi:hypothetical protein
MRKKLTQKFSWLNMTLLSALVLSGCDFTPTVNKICKEHPHLCTNFIKDTWCKGERRELIVNRYRLMKGEIKEDEENLYFQLINLESYSKCMQKASLIEHIKLKEKKTIRTNNHIKAQEQLKTLVNKTRHSNYPYLSYYHWSRYQDEAALKRFLSLEGSNDLESPELQFNLATYYSKFDSEKTIGLLFHALELIEDESQINSEIFNTLSTLYLSKDKYQQAYIWSKILDIYQPSKVDMGIFDNYALFSRAEKEKLERTAKITLDKIKDGKFISPR